MSDKLTHFDGAGNAVMVDVSAKNETARLATATGKIKMNAAAFAALQSGTVQKGDVLGIARIAGIMGLKQTAQLIPLCHPIATEKAEIEFTLLPNVLAVQVFCTVHTTGKTGVEMEALTGVNIALLTIYDMCKALDKGMELYDICLLKKTGGKSGAYIKESEKL
ncbi:cyclic pyranopterin monophosphate synthase MoaC [Ruminococcaceae bacterium OttesenSCG-928-A16]|nr:cyclic pyranopterin monophosphate synthase MoaC [Ruminococcaceae bacterium OttesenSCG-928-A16]